MEILMDKSRHCLLNRAASSASEKWANFGESSSDRPCQAKHLSIIANRLP
jgi:hypothetical protein